MAGLIVLMLSVTALQASRRRAGMAFSSNETLVDPATVTADQVDLLVGDPLLSVGLTAIGEDGERDETVMLSGKSGEEVHAFLHDTGIKLLGQDQGTDLSQPVGGQVADTGAGGLTDPASATTNDSSAVSAPTAPADTQATAAAPIPAVAKPAKQGAGQKPKP